MRKLLLLTLAIVGVVALAGTSSAFAATIFSDGFESSPNHYLNWTSADSKWDSNSSGEYSGDFSAEVKGDTDGTDNLVKLISTTGNENITLSFYYRANGLEDYDNDKVEVYYTLNGGSSWTEISSMQIDDDNDDDSWHQYTYSAFPSGADNNANFGFRFSAQLDDANDKVWIDQVLLSGDAIIVDTDGDTVPDSIDNCDEVDNLDQINTDGDAMGDACDTDDDGDGDLDVADNCPLVSNADQTDSDNDEVGDACDTDDDNDGDLDNVDNCPINANSDQLDTDSDGQGDVCDSDDDNDEIVDGEDSCPLDAANTCDDPTTGTITIIKEVVGGSGSFDFHIYTDGETQVGGETLSASEGESDTSIVYDFVPGTYTVYEDSQVDWTLTSATCTDGEVNFGSFEENSGVFGIVLEAGDNVTCTFTNTYTGDEEPSEFVTVTIVKYIDGEHATVENADGASFLMTSSWDAENIGAGSGAYSLSTAGFNNANPYRATTSDMTPGASYSTQEEMNEVVSLNCTEGEGSTPFAFVGYSVGDTLEAAATAEVSTTAPELSEITTNKYIIVWNEDCSGDGGGGGEEPVNETNATLCGDGQDNDFNGYTDLNDASCALYKPEVHFTKTIVADNVNGLAWAHSVGDFLINFVRGDYSESGSSDSWIVLDEYGTFDVSEIGPAGYAATYGGACEGGTLTINPGEEAYCTITNDDLPQCSNGLDDDGDGRTDDSDGACSGAADDDEGNDIFPGGGQTTGSVLGASTEGSTEEGSGDGKVAGAIAVCELWLDGYIKDGSDPKTQHLIVKLQTFLNEWTSAGLKETGVYDAPTIAAVKKFQKEHAKEVLGPWGNIEETGWTYITTTYLINKLVDSDCAQEMPELVPFR